MRRADLPNTLFETLIVRPRDVMRAMWASHHGTTAAGLILKGTTIRSAQIHTDEAGHRGKLRIARQRPTWRDWLQLIRLHQWAKNFLFFIPIILSGLFTGWGPIKDCIVGFFLMGLCASGSYILNDLSDLEADRLHATKRYRPLASGRITLMNGLIAAILLIAVGLIGGLWYELPFGELLVAYLAMTLSYTFFVKSVPVLDVMVLALLYTLRLLMGAGLADDPLSGWLIACSLFFFFSLSLAKRQTELVKHRRRHRDRIPGRGYRTSDAPFVLALGVSSGVIAILLIMLFVFLQAYHQPNYEHPSRLLGTPMFTTFWLGRIWLFAARGELTDDPVTFALTDRVSLGLGILLLGSALLAVSPISL